MKKILLFLLLIPTLIYADAVIFSGSDVKALKQNLDLFGVVKVMSGSADPTSGGGVAAPVGSAYLRTNGSLYTKTAVGNTAWTKNALLPVSLTADVTGILPIANGGTGSATQNFVDLTTNQTIAGTKTFSSTISGSINGNAATVTTNANLTGPITSVGNATSIASQTGTGTKFVMDTSPTLVTPNIGAATGTSLNTTGAVTANDFLFNDTNFNTVSSKELVAGIGGTGVASGGVVSIGTPNTTASISDGFGYVTVNTGGTASLKRVSWTGLTNFALTFRTTNLVTYLAIDNTGSVVQQVTPFTDIQARDNIVIGAAVHTNLSTVNAVNQLQHVILSPINQLQDLQNSLGFFNVSGNIYSANGANLNINKSAGVIHKTGSNWDVNAKDPNVRTLASGTAITFRYRTQTGAEGSDVTSIDPNNYDAAGTITAVPNAKFTIQRIAVFSSNLTRIQYGQNIYNTQADALAAIQTETFTTEANIAQNGLLRGFLILKKGATDLTSSTDAFFLEAPKFGGASGVGGLSTTTMQGAYNNSSTPQITTTTALGSVDMKRGSAADTDYVMRILNGAGSLTAGFTGNGNLTASGVASTGVTGTGKVVFDTSPTLVTPTLGVATATTINSTTIPSSKTLETKDTLTTKGDIYVATGATTTARQAVGADDSGLIADSTRTNGIFWATTKAKGNLLSNYSFEQLTHDNYWTITGGGSTGTSSTTNVQDGGSALSRTSTGAWTVIQDVTAFAAGKSGQNAEISIWVYSATANADIWLCPRINGVSVTASVANGCQQYTALGSPQQLTIFPLFGSTSTGIEVKGSGAITYILDDAYLGDRRNSVAGITTTPETACSFSSLAWTGAGTVTNNLKCLRIGSFLVMRGKFTTGTVSGSTVSIPLPNNWGTITTASTLSSNQIVGTGLREAVSASTLYTYIVSSSQTTIGLSGPIVSNSNNPSTPSGGTTVFNSAEVQDVSGEIRIPIQEWQGDGNAISTRCDDPRNCNTKFNLAGTTTSGTISSQDGGTSFPWVSSCTAANPSVCTFSSALGITVTPTCSAKVGATAIGTSATVTAVSTSSVSVQTFTTSTGAAAASIPFILDCAKQGVDEISSRVSQQIVQSRGVPIVPGASGGIDTFTVSYGTTAVSTVCSASPCSYLDQIGNAVSSITRAGTGSYALGTGRTYSKLKCVYTGGAAGGLGAIAGSGGGQSCSSCNSLSFTTYRSDTAAAADTFGTLYCQGSY